MALLIDPRLDLFGDLYTGLILKKKEPNSTGEVTVKLKNPLKFAVKLRGKIYEIYINPLTVATGDN